ncbi:MAG: hypothetical protein IPL08_13680 [Saprospiraceae bacterium]|nr:hypothetical protein [Saprospiraceae bacterium]
MRESTFVLLPRFFGYYKRSCYKATSCGTFNDDGIDIYNVIIFRGIALESKLCNIAQLPCDVYSSSIQDVIFKSCTVCESTYVIPC